MEKRLFTSKRKREKRMRLLGDLAQSLLNAFAKTVTASEKVHIFFNIDSLLHRGMFDIDLLGKFPEVVRSFKREFRRQVHDLLFTFARIPSDLASPLEFDPKNRDMSLQFHFFETHWNQLRRFPNFSALYLSLLVTVTLPVSHKQLLLFLIEATSQTPAYNSSLLSVLLPLAFTYFPDSLDFTSINNALFECFPSDVTVPIFCHCLRRFPDSVCAYRFLDQYSSLFDVEDIRSVAKLLLTLADVVDYANPTLFPMIDAVRQQLSRVGYLIPFSGSAATGSCSNSFMQLTIPLDECFDEIESNDVTDDPLVIVRHIAGHLRKLPFPDRPFRPTMYFCLKTWSALEIDDSLDASKCLDVLKKIHALDDEAADIHAAYDEFSVDPRLRDAPVELGYSDFRRLRGGMLPDGSELPYSLAKGREVDERGELAILQMQKLTTAYDGVTNMWELLKWAPNYDLASRFEAFSASRKCFLIAGFRAKLAGDRDRGASHRAMIIDRLERLLYTPKRNVDHEVSKIGERLSKMHEEAARLTADRRKPKSQPGDIRPQTLTPRTQQWSMSDDLFVINSNSSYFAAVHAVVRFSS
jgi:hypothetical protein